jgi:hypothetical protein
LAPEEGYDIELAPVGLLVAASDGHVIATNQAWSELSNLSGPDSTGQGFLAALAPAERPRFQDDLRQVALGTGQVVGDYHLEAGSTWRRTRWWLRPHNRNGVPLVVMAVGDFTSPLISPAEPGSRLTPAGTPIEVADVIQEKRKHAEFQPERRVRCHRGPGKQPPAREHAGAAAADLAGDGQVMISRGPLAG